MHHTGLVLPQKDPQLHPGGDAITTVRLESQNTSETPTCCRLRRKRAKCPSAGKQDVSFFFRAMRAWQRNCSSVSCVASMAPIRLVFPLCSSLKHHDCTERKKKHHIINTWGVQILQFLKDRNMTMVCFLLKTRNLIIVFKDGVIITSRVTMLTRGK